MVERRALAKTLADKANVVSRLEHHVEKLLGSTDAGTMRLRDEPQGLDYEVDLPDTSAGRDTFVLTQRGDLKSASMGFVAYEEEFRHEGSALVRHLVSIKLTEISPTVNPAYPETSTALRHLATQVGEDPEDVFELARRKELRSLFVRTDNVQSAPVEVRSDVTTQEGLSTAEARRQLDAMRPPERRSPRRLQLDLMRMRGEFERPPLSIAEARAQLPATDPREI